jgi:hypothetical protein
VRHEAFVEERQSACVKRCHLAQADQLLSALAKSQSAPLQGAEKSPGGQCS